MQYKTLTLSTDPLAGKPAVAHIEEAAADAAADNSDEDEEEENESDAERAREFPICLDKIDIDRLCKYHFRPDRGDGRADAEHA